MKKILEKIKNLKSQAFWFLKKKVNIPFERVGTFFGAVKKRLPLKALGIIFRVFEYVAVAFLILVVFVSFSPRFDFPGGYKSLVVLSGSMEPAIKTGSVVLVQPQESYAVGDVVTVNKSLGEVEHVTHRIVEMEGNKIITKGDANNAPDNWELSRGDIEGSVLFDVPYLGYAVNFAKSQRGFFLLVILPALLIIISEIWEIKKELEKSYEEKLEKALEAKNAGQDAAKAAGILLVFAFGALTFATGATTAFFSDTEEATATITVGTWEDEDDVEPGDVVINEVYYDVADGKKGESSEAKYEWIELYNPSSQKFKLKGWEVCDNYDCREIHPNNIEIKPDEFVLISHDTSIWQNYWEDIPENTQTVNLGGSIWGGLANGEDMLVLRDDSGTIIDQMNWGEPDTAWTNYNSDLWDPGPTAPKGSSLARTPKGFDSDSPGDWEVLGDEGGETPNPGTNPHSVSDENDKDIGEEDKGEEDESENGSGGQKESEEDDSRPDGSRNTAGTGDSQERPSKPDGSSEAADTGDSGEDEDEGEDEEPQKPEDSSDSAGADSGSESSDDPSDSSDATEDEDENENGDGDDSDGSEPESDDEAETSDLSDDTPEDSVEEDTDADADNSSDSGDDNEESGSSENDSGTAPDSSDSSDKPDETLEEDDTEDSGGDDNDAAVDAGDATTGAKDADDTDDSSEGDDSEEPGVEETDASEKAADGEE